MTVIKNIFWLFMILVAIGWLWEILEMVFYGTVQPRKVDDIISFVWVVWWCWRIKKGAKTRWSRRTYKNECKTLL